jgi:hypothetical protein
VKFNGFIALKLLRERGGGQFSSSMPFLSGEYFWYSTKADWMYQKYREQKCSYDFQRPGRKSVFTSFLIWFELERYVINNYVTSICLPPPFFLCVLGQMHENLFIGGKKYLNLFI